MLHEALRCPVGEPGFRIGLHRFFTVFCKLLDGQHASLVREFVQTLAWLD